MYIYIYISISRIVQVNPPGDLGRSSTNGKMLFKAQMQKETCALPSTYFLKDHLFFHAEFKATPILGDTYMILHVYQMPWRKFSHLFAPKSERDINWCRVPGSGPPDGFSLLGPQLQWSQNGGEWGDLHSWKMNRFEASRIEIWGKIMKYLVDKG